MAKWYSRRPFRRRFIPRTRESPRPERTEPEFRREFLLVLANQIARHFFTHDPNEDVGLDATTLK